MPYTVYAHRGASSYAPENTLRSFYMGLEMGANGIETDVQRTKDGVLVLFHDDTLERVTGAHGSIADYTLQELRALRVVCPEFPERTDVICTLEEFLEHFSWRPLTFAVELKQPGTEAQTLTLLDRYGMKERTWITSFSLPALACTHALAPDWRLGWLAEDFSDDDLVLARQTGIGQLCPEARTLHAERVRQWNAAGFSVRAWGIADETLMRRAVQCGTNGQTVNFPDRLLAWLQER